MALELVPVTREEAAEFVRRHHRHSPVRIGDKFRVAAALDGEVVAVAQVGRPVAIALDDGWTVEVLRLCSDGTRNACSFLYAACWRAARALGYRRLVTYTLASEPGASLRAAGWRVVAQTDSRGKGSHGSSTRPRVEREGQTRLRWEAVDHGS